jgi:hypothetical protein
MSVALLQSPHKAPINLVAMHKKSHKIAPSLAAGNASLFIIKSFHVFCSLSKILHLFSFIASCHPDMPAAKKLHH